MSTTTCSACGAADQSTAFCTSCGQALTPGPAAVAPNDSYPESLSIPPARSRKPLALALSAAMALSLGIGGFLLFFRESPAVPFLRDACGRLVKIEFGDSSIDDKKAVLNAVRAPIGSALAADSELAAPFSDVVSRIENVISQHEAAIRKAALGLALSSSIILRGSIDDLSDSSEYGDQLTADIKAICTAYTAN